MAASLLLAACDSANSGGDSPSQPPAPRPPAGPVCSSAGTDTQDGQKVYVVRDSGEPNNPSWLAIKNSDGSLGPPLKWDYPSGDNQPSYYPYLGPGGVVCKMPPVEKADLSEDDLVRSFFFPRDTLAEAFFSGVNFQNPLPVLQS